MTDGSYRNWILQLLLLLGGEGRGSKQPGPVVRTNLLSIGIRYGLTFADVALLDQPPKHVCAVVTVGRPVKCFLAETVPMAGWGIGRDRRHDPRPTAAPFTPDFHREITLCTIILHLYVISEPYTNIVVPERIPEIQSYMPKAHFGMPSLHSRPSLTDWREGNSLRSTVPRTRDAQRFWSCSAPGHDEKYFTQLLILSIINSY